MTMDTSFICPFQGFIPSDCMCVHGRVRAHTHGAWSTRQWWVAGVSGGSLSASVNLKGSCFSQPGTYTSDEEGVAGDPLHGLQQEAGKGHSFTSRVRCQPLQNN